MIAKGMTGISLTLTLASAKLITKLFPAFVIVIGSLGRAARVAGSRGGVVWLPAGLAFIIDAAAAFNVGEFITPRPKEASPPMPLQVAALMPSCAMPWSVLESIAKTGVDDGVADVVLLP